MSASQANLSQELELAVLSGALSLQEAWSLEDQFLQVTNDWLELPLELQLPFNKLLLWQTEPYNDLPL